MTGNRTQTTSTMSTRQKVTVVAFVVILIFLIWQIWGLIRGPSQPQNTPTTAKMTSTTTTTQTTNTSNTISNQGAPRPPQAGEIPKPGQPAVLSQREIELMRMQQETEAKYLAALNELQMLKVNREIAETYKAIMAAKLDTITAEKNIVDLLKPPVTVTQPSYAQGLVSPTTTTSTVTNSAQNPPPAVIPPPAADTPYTVISVSKLLDRWNAVLGAQGRLYSVNIGDILPIDQSKVIVIDKAGVILEKNGIRRRVSLVPII